MTALLAVAVGGALGSLLRAGVAALAAARPAGDLPWGTVLVNLGGSLGLGLLAGWVNGDALLLLGVGGMGGLTTFSTAMAESVRLGRFGERGAAVGYTVVTLLGSLALAWIGLTISGGR